MQGASQALNLDGLIVTVPHKVAHVAELTPRARVAGAVNVLRRRVDGSWLGDTTDGQSFVTGLRQAGCEPRGMRALLVGAGGAGAAIAAALIDAGVTELAIHSRSSAPIERLVAALSAYRPDARVVRGSADPAGYDLVANASTAGMRAGDPLPVDIERLSRQTFVGDVITAPEVTPLLAAARAAGCATQTGLGMVAQAIGLMTDFFLAAKADQARLPAM
jgi:shikimate dehydrogenase